MAKSNSRYWYRPTPEEWTARCEAVCQRLMEPSTPAPPPDRVYYGPNGEPYYAWFFEGSPPHVVLYDD